VTEAAPISSLHWREVITTAVVVFLVASTGSVATFTFWLQEIAAPQVVLLGSGSRLSLLVTDGPARLLLATGDDPIEYENALTHVQPIIARRVDLLLIAGSGDTLRVPLAAHADSHVRRATALAPLPHSAEADAIGAMPSFSSPQHIRLGPSTDVTVETAFPFGADTGADFPAWRATVQHGQTRVVVLSDGPAVSLFPPPSAPSVLAISGADPAAAWDLSPAVAFVANSEMIGGDEMRAAFTASRRPPQWGYRVFPGEALRLRFVAGGVELPSAPANRLAGTPAAAAVIPRAVPLIGVIPRHEGSRRSVAYPYAATRFLTAARNDTIGSRRPVRAMRKRRVRRRVPLSPARTRP
jgi:hypothetical protein